MRRQIGKKATHVYLKRERRLVETGTLAHPRQRGVDEGKKRYEGDQHGGDVGAQGDGRRRTDRRRLDYVVLRAVMEIEDVTGFASYSNSAVSSLMLTFTVDALCRINVGLMA